MQDGAAVQQLRSGTEDHRRARDAGLRTRRARRATTSSCSPTAARSARSATRPTPSPATTRCWCAGTTASHTTSASTGRRSRWPSWRELVSAAARELFGYRGKVVLGKAQEADYLVDNPNRRCPKIDKARAHLGFDPKVLGRGGRLSLARLVLAQSHRGGRLMRISIVGTGYVGLVTRRVPRRARPRRHLRRRRSGARSRRSTPDARRFTRAACPRSSQRTVGRKLQGDRAIWRAPCTTRR